MWLAFYSGSCVANVPFFSKIQDHRLEHKGAKLFNYYRKQNQATGFILRFATNLTAMQLV